MWCSAVQCIKGSSRGGSLAAKNPGTEHSDVAFSSLLPSAPAATADDSHNKNSASDLLRRVSLK